MSTELLSQDAQSGIDLLALDRSGINRRELEIIRLLAEGHTYTQIGKMTMPTLTRDNVAYSVRALCAKLGAENAAHIVAICIRRKIIL